MTARETIRYMLAVCVLWALTYWRSIALAVAVIVIVLIVGR